MISLPVNELLKDKDYQLGLELIAGQRGLAKKIMIPQIQKPGLALAGHPANLQPGRIQVLGNSEVRFLNELPAPKISQILKKICRLDITCFVLTSENNPPAALARETEKAGIPVLRTKLMTGPFIMRVTKFLEDRLTETTTLHGVLMDVFGVGVLLLGKSGIGKSECALELVMKGHR